MYIFSTLFPVVLKNCYVVGRCICLHVRVVDLQHTPEPGREPFRWVSFDIATNNATHAIIDTTFQLLVRAPWVRMHVPSSLLLDVTYMNVRVARVRPEIDDPHQHGAWIAANGWNTLAATVVAEPSGAAAAGSLISHFVERTPLSVKLSGDVDNVELMRTCLAQSGLF